MKKLLVIGGAGFIGKHLVREAVLAGHTVYATHRPGKKPAAMPGVHWLATDLNEPEAENWPAFCDTVIFLAQSRHWRNFPESARDVFEINLQALMRAVWYAQRVGVQRFLYASTGSVYTQKQRTLRESDPFDVQEPRSFYVASKLAGELLLGPYQAFFPVVSLRLFMPYGEGQNSDMLMPRLVNCVQEGKPIKLHGQDGLLANPVAVGDIAEVILRCLRLDVSTTLNVGGPERLSLREIGTTLGRVLGREPVFEVQDGVAAPVMVGDTALLKQTLGWQPSTRLEDGLRQWLGRHESYSAVPA